MVWLTLCLQVSWNTIPGSSLFLAFLIMTRSIPGLPKLPALSAAGQLLLMTCWRPLTNSRSTLAPVKISFKWIGSGTGVEWKRTVSASANASNEMIPVLDWAVSGAREQPDCMDR